MESTASQVSFRQLLGVQNNGPLYGNITLIGLQGMAALRSQLCQWWTWGSESASLNQFHYVQDLDLLVEVLLHTSWSDTIGVLFGHGCSRFHFQLGFVVAFEGFKAALLWTECNGGWWSNEDLFVFIWQFNWLCSFIISTWQIFGSGKFCCFYTIGVCP